MNGKQYQNDGKVKLSKELQLKMLEFFLHTSIPRMTYQNKEHG